MVSQATMFNFATIELIVMLIAIAVLLAPFELTPRKREATL